MKYYTRLYLPPHKPRAGRMAPEPHSDEQRAAIEQVMQSNMPEGYVNAAVAARDATGKGVYYPRNQARCGEITKLLKEAGCTVSTYDIVVFDESEITQACLAMLYSKIEVPGIYCARDELYDLSRACPQCGSAAPQKRALRFRPSDLKQLSRQLLTTYRPYQYVISDELLRMICDERGIEHWSRPIENGRGIIIPGWRQAVAHRTLPKLSPATGLIRLYPCPLCERDGYISEKEPFEPVITAEEGRQIMAEEDPWFNTWECFGDGAGEGTWPIMKNRARVPDMVFSQRVIRAVHGLKLRHIEVLPMQFLQPDGHVTLVP